MSGGHFDYAFGRVAAFAEQLEHELGLAGKPRWRYGWKDTWPEYEPATTAELRRIITETRLCANLMREVEWLFSGDTGDEEFMRRVAEIRRGEG